MNPLEGGDRLDRCLVRLGWAASRREAKELIAGDRVRVNGRRGRKGETVARDDNVEVVGPTFPAGLGANPELRIQVLFEDESVLVVNKPGLVPCHPLRPGVHNTVMNAIAAAYPECASAGDKLFEGGLVHRLDNGTSGALIIARTPDALETLRDAIRAGRVMRRYEALLTGRLDEPMEIATPIAHHPKNPRRMVALAPADNRTSGGGTRRRRAAARPAATIIVPRGRHGRFTFADVIPRTGRRHQIRVHLASVGLPLAGDALYGGAPLAELAPGRFWLHLAELHFDAPASGRVEVQAPLAEELTVVLVRIR